MQPFNLARWQAQHGFTYESAANALGVCRATYAKYIKMEREGKPLPRLVELACKAVYIQQPEEKGDDLHSISNIDGSGGGSSYGPDGSGGG